MDHWYTRWALALASDIRLGQLNSCSRLLCCPPSALQCGLFDSVAKDVNG
jgi:hypothetical protein